MSTPPYLGRSRRALQAAADLLDELRVDQEEPLDVFQAVEDLGLWLVFQPLDGLLGAVLPQGQGGIMITTQRRPAIQRYTAAHEIGHWQLDHSPLAFDTDHDILNPDANERERLAQWFASYLLMPPPLVHATASRYGVRNNAPVSPSQAYQVARDMGVSYEAALRQMTNLRVITDNQRDGLLETQPLRAKQELAHGHRPENGYADVWIVDMQAPQHHKILIGDEIVITLPENRSTGYRWLDDNLNMQRAVRRARPAPPPLVPDALTAPADKAEPVPGAGDHAAGEQATPVPPTASSLQVVFDAYEPGWAPVTSRNVQAVRRHIASHGHTADNPLRPSTELGPTRSSPDPSTPGVGATGRRWLAVKAQTEGDSTFLLHYAAPYDPHTPPAATFAVEATVQPLPQVLQRRQLLEAFLDEADAAASSGDDQGRHEVGGSAGEDDTHGGSLW
jgi:Zn-dependent peptidase ImmA (M78 family)/predicted secreted protein